jgi:holo-[acyl-carrier protein] synthase
VILGVGIDLVAVARVERLLARHGARFLDRCFVNGEAIRPGDAEHLAGLLAAKEAAFKALGTGWGAGVGWRSVAVTRPGGRGPALELSGAAAVRAGDLGVRHSHVSISHDAGVAVAVVVLES